MKTALFLFFFCVSHSMGIDYANFIERWEGRVHSQYVCPQGFATIGVGHKVKQGESFPRKLTNSQIDKILKADIDIAIRDARRIFKNFDQHPEVVKLIMVDLAFNLGHPRLSKFVKTISAFDVFDYKTASFELQHSRWFNQTGQRSRHHVKTLLKLSP